MAYQMIYHYLCWGCMHLGYCFEVNKMVGWLSEVQFILLVLEEFALYLDLLVFDLVR